MRLYLLIIGIADLILISLHAGSAPLWQIALYAIGGTLAVIALDALGAFVIRQLPTRYFDAEHCQMAIGKGERQLYKKMGIKKWKDRIPELGQFTDFHKNKVADKGDAAYLGRFILECNYVLSLLPVFVLRYNLSTLQYLYKKARA